MRLTIRDLRLRVGRAVLLGVMLVAGMAGALGAPGSPDRGTRSDREGDTIRIARLGTRSETPGGFRSCPFVPSRPFATTIEDFEDGAVTLGSFPGEDVQPDSWSLDTLVTHDSSRFALKLFGNTWKLESIAPVVLESGAVWQVSAYVYSTGELQGFALADSAHVLQYAFAGTVEANPDSWVTVYQGAFSIRQWHDYQLPVAEDWRQRFGYLPTVRAIVYINDRDAGARAVTYFDDIAAVTEDLPVAPVVDVWYEQGRVTNRREGGHDPNCRTNSVMSPVGRATTDDAVVQFHSRVTDPDSPWHSYLWRFGDDSTSTDSAPEHRFSIADNHEYRVLLEVRDSTGLVGRATCRVVVDPGPSTLPVTMNFVGDIMLARAYDLPGGIIDTLGAGGIFAPTKPWLGDAADITVANLESPLTNRGTRHPTKPIVFRGRPTNVSGLVDAGIDVVSLANNHVIDYGLSGLQQMDSVLDVNGIQRSGAGANEYEARLPLFRLKSGLNVAFLSMCDRNGQYDNLQPYLDAGFDKPGFAMLDTFHLREAIAAVREAADVVVVELHTGEEYEPAPWNSELRMTNGEWRAAGSGHDPTGRGNDKCLMTNDKDGDEYYNPRAPFPAPGDTAERHRAIAYGADAVICHHPHMLQGFEVYEGKLIAHSLGDFVFDLNYPETYPTVILDSKLDERGFYEYTVVPVFIDDYIPVRAQGGLGRHILDDMAQRSRALGTYFVTNRDSVTARIVLDTTTLLPGPVAQGAQVRLDSGAGYWTSSPLNLARAGSIARITQVAPTRTWQYRLGRELVWNGGFEDEGSTEWVLNDSEERYDTVALQGSRSLCHVQTTGGSTVETGLAGRPVMPADSGSYSLYCNIKTQNARNATMTVECYSGRSGSTPLASPGLAAPVSGTTGWQSYHADFTPPSGTGYFDVVFSSDAPLAGGAGKTWFDSAGVIQWGPWQNLSLPQGVLAPNDWYWLQVRAPTTTDSATINYVENTYAPASGVAGGAVRSTLVRSLRVFPNPAFGDATIAYDLGAAAAVRLVVFNSLGQQVRVLARRTEAAGRHGVAWDGTDARGRRLAPGSYFCRLQAGSSSSTAKLILQ